MSGTAAENERTSNVGNSKAIPVVVTTASGSCSKEELMERGFAGCLLKPFSISELMEVSDKCAMKGNRNEKPDFTSLLSYGNEAIMLEKLVAETEKEMQAIREAGLKKDLQEPSTSFTRDTRYFRDSITFSLIFCCICGSSAY